MPGCVQLIGCVVDSCKEGRGFDLQHRPYNSIIHFMCKRSYSTSLWLRYFRVCHEKKHLSVQTQTLWICFGIAVRWVYSSGFSAYFFLVETLVVSFNFLLQFFFLHQYICYRRICLCLFFSDSLTFEMYYSPFLLFIFESGCL